MNKLNMEHFDPNIVNETRVFVAAGVTFIIVTGVTIAILISRARG